MAIILKWITGIFEALLGVPFLGGAFILSMGWTPLFFMFILHLITLIFAHKEGYAKGGSILGLVTSFIGVIPVVGMIMHIITAIVLLIDAATSNKRMNRNPDVF